MSIHATDQRHPRVLTSRVVERILWIATAIAIVGGGATWVRESRAAPVRSTRAPIITAPGSIAMIDSSSLSDAVDRVFEGNLFRRERRPADPGATVAGGAAPMPPQLPQPPKPPKPHPILRGLLGGPPWDAVLEGVPGREGNVVVRVGETSGGLTVRAVRRDTVIVQGADTIWKLTFHRP